MTHRIAERNLATIRRLTYELKQQTGKRQRPLAARPPDFASDSEDPNVPIAGITTLAHRTTHRILRNSNQNRHRGRMATGPR